MWCNKWQSCVNSSDFHTAVFLEFQKRPVYGVYAILSTIKHSRICLGWSALQTFSVHE